MKLSNPGKIISVIGIVALILSLNFFQKEFKGFVYSLSSPLQESSWRNGGKVADFFSLLGRIGDLNKENEDLRKENEDLLATNGFLLEAEKENVALREALALGLEEDFQLLLAQVVSKDVGHDGILINKGKKDGVSEGLPVINSSQVLLGRVTEVYDSFSRAALISSQESSFDAKISGADITGVVKGRGSLGLDFELILPEEEIKEGDFVITSSLAEIYPRGLLVGEIIQIEKQDTGSFQRAELSPLFDLDKTDSVFLILNFP
jgi:rod shape-determining protein MreC